MPTIDENTPPEKNYSRNRPNAFKLRANNVFGDLLVDDVDTQMNLTCNSTHSLSYSPSPLGHNQQKVNRVHKSNSNDDKTKPTPKKFSFDGMEDKKPISALDEKETKKKSSGPIAIVTKPTIKKKTNTPVKKKQPKSSKRFHGLPCSPLKPDMKKKAQQAINNATRSINQSINQSLNAVRKAKSETAQEKRTNVVKFKKELHDEKLEAALFYKETDSMKREIREMQSQATSNMRKAIAERKRAEKQDQLEGVQQEIEFKSSRFRVGRQNLKQAQDESRRMSTETRSKIRAENKIGLMRLKLSKIEEDQASIDERHASSLAMIESKNKEQERRRKSYFFRNGDARRIRQLHAKVQDIVAKEEHKSYELKWAGEKDTEEYRKKIAEDRRASLAFRNEEGMRQREAQQQMKSDNDISEHESFELKWAAEKDTEEYMKQIAEDRRDSFAYRNEEGKRHREIQQRIKSDNDASEHESYELKWAAEKDTEEYRKKIAEDSREIFAFCNEEGKRQREVQRQIKSNNAISEHESYELKWAAEKDTEAYRKTIAEDRRDSFAFRNEEGTKQRQVQQQIKSDNDASEHESYELKWAAEKDTEEYRKQIADDRRDSFAFRNEEGKIHREVQQQIKSNKDASEHESYELKWAAEKDAEEYSKQIAEDRRDSFAFRNEEGMRQREVQQQMKSDNDVSEHESYELKWAAEKDTEEYRKQIAEDRRDSFAFRNEEGKRQREIQQQIKSNLDASEHESYELKWAAEKDAEAHKKKLAKDCREIFAFRNEEGKRQREVEQQIKSYNDASEHESYELKWAAEKDTDAYRKQIADDRRVSFAFRNEEGKIQREIQQQMKSDNDASEHESYKLKWAAEKDAEEHQKKIAEDRRASFAFRNEEGMKQREAQQQIKSNNNISEHESYKLKWAAEKDAEEYMKQIAEDRRDSFAFRNEEGKRQREMQQQMKSDNDASEHESYVLKWAAEKDVEEYRKEIAEDRRVSFAFRNEEGMRQREVQQQIKSNNDASEHKSYELKWAAEKDTEEYRKQIAEDRRVSFAFRNEEGMRQREVQQQIKSNNDASEHESYELKWAAEKDAEEYRKQIDEDRRDSFAFRNEEGKRHRAVMEELTALSKEKEHESIILKWAGESDAKKYVENEEEKRRMSLAFRNEEARIHRELAQEMHVKHIEEAADEERLKAECQKDVNQYTASCARRDRTSLCFRRKEAHIQRTKEDERRMEDVVIEQSSRRLDDEAREDVKGYVKSCKRRQRLSLVCRAKEKRQHFKWDQKKNESERKQFTRDVKERALDNKYIQLAKEKERAMKAMDAIRHSGCTFAVNPFLSLLG